MRTLAGLEDSLVLKAEIDGARRDCLVDTGASVSLVSAEMVPKEVSVQPTDKKLRSVTGQELDVSGEVALSVAKEIGLRANSLLFVVLLLVQC